MFNLDSPRDPDLFLNGALLQADIDRVTVRNGDSLKCVTSSKPAPEYQWALGNGLTYSSDELVVQNLKVGINLSSSILFESKIKKNIDSTVMFEFQ